MAPQTLEHVNPTALRVDIDRFAVRAVHSTYDIGIPGTAEPFEEFTVISDPQQEMTQ